jgi:hypothetical protein
VAGSAGKEGKVKGKGVGREKSVMKILIHMETNIKGGKQ